MPSRNMSIFLGHKFQVCIRVTFVGCPVKRWGHFRYPGPGLFSSCQKLIWPQGAVTNSQLTRTVFSEHSFSGLMYVLSCSKNCARIFQRGLYCMWFSHMVSFLATWDTQRRVGITPVRVPLDWWDKACCRKLCALSVCLLWMDVLCALR